MKKSYIIPETFTVKIKTDSLLVQYSSTQAASDAVSLSREGGRHSDIDWGDED